VIRIGAPMTVLAVVGVVAFVVATRNPTPGAFYDSPDDLDSGPGTILRSEPFSAGLPSDARGWKVLYTSTDAGGDPVAVSGLVIAPAAPAPGPHPVLAWAHGTTGIARACAPSLSDDPLEGIPDMTGPLERGWVITLTDYRGLGTAGPHPYLVGDTAGRDVLDSVRAVHQLDIGIELADEYAIWGHSQGGHAALFAGQLAAGYLPELSLAGVAALAPATTLQDNLAAIEGTQIGNVLTIFAIRAWTAHYPDIPDGTLDERARRPAERLARQCLNQPSRFRLLADALLLPATVAAIDPTTDPRWARRLDENTPAPAGITAPVFVAQGLADDTIVPPVTEAWTTRRCATASPTVWRTYPDVNHIAVVGPGGTDALSWTLDRFDGTTPATTCPPR
jgi:alpha-beta hydrolase superfamily lysophospholipase